MLKIRLFELKNKMEKKLLKFLNYLIDIINLKEIIK